MEGDHSPRFGNWDTDANVPYTQYFEKVVKNRTEVDKVVTGRTEVDKVVKNRTEVDKVVKNRTEVDKVVKNRTEVDKVVKGRTEVDKVVTGRTEVDKVVKGRTEGKSNSSHPDENPDTFSKDESATHRTRPKTELPKPKNDSRAGEDGDRTRHSPTHSDTVAPKPISVSPGHRTADRTVSGESQRKMYKTNGGAVDRSIDTSPLHSQYQVKSAGRGGGPTPWERKNPAEGSHGLSNTPGRPKLRTIGHGDDIPEKSSTVPPFGAWENDPSTADKYSDIFTRVREEKEAGSPKVPNFVTDSKYLYNKQDKKFKSSSCGCFNWGRK